ncbi:deoxyuridine 5'-triphosphate nucleotidohydrolase [Chryseobacterium luquanense]|uniref:Deoxyuridine 5'-triphosphate nucleotidohydrolase n=1 Tax=Chryseobacterium luquanense TaxID=2983766 RepID=A0ABT3Y6F5_9FLAO|nr:deoxyuridine 5'-triphosphate nucleotidohydrolase [Chryseobacterium luquanense]MCX8533745.1 deoxyuridine 5'-triphosphate nucleotidohydrolase [Chryseobacterium luquanense]
MEYSKEFKAALSQLSTIEKDRLIFRLLRKDEILSKKLYFELIDEETVDQKRDAMEDLIKEKVEYASKYISNQKYFIVLIRKISAQITEHVKVTSDKFGDISLNLLLINEILESNEKLSRQRFNDVYKLYLYIINKVVKALTLTKKLDEDYWMEIDEYLSVSHERVTGNIYLEKLFINNGIDFNWFNTDRIPDHFDLIIKDIKNQGFLK